MKKVLVNILIILAIVAACDIAMGFVGNKILMSTPEVGTLQADAYHAMFKKKADVLIIGSSRARHTFSPSLITDSTGLTAYNAGYDGHGMHYSLIVLQSFLERCKPQVVVLEACAAMVTSEWLNNSIDDVKHFYGLHAPLTNYVKEYGTWQLKTKLHSNLYRLNSTPTWMAKARTLPSHNCDGYEPLCGNLADTTIINFTNFETNENFMNYADDKIFKQIDHLLEIHENIFDALEDHATLLSIFLEKPDLIQQKNPLEFFINTYSNNILDCWFLNKINFFSK